MSISKAYIEEVLEKSIEWMFENPAETVEFREQHPGFTRENFNLEKYCNEFSEDLQNMINSPGDTPEDEANVKDIILDQAGIYSDNCMWEFEDRFFRDRGLITAISYMVSAEHNLRTQDWDTRSHEQWVLTIEEHKRKAREIAAKVLA